MNSRAAKMVMGLFIAFAAFPRIAYSDDTWVGNAATSNWSDTNWSGNNPPATGEAIFFGTPGTNGTNPNNDLATDYSIGGITFNSTATLTNYSLNGNEITLTGGITNNSTSQQNINLGILTTGIRTITTTAGGGDLAIGGVITDGGSSTGGITLAGGGTVILQGSNTYGGATTTAAGSVLQIANTGALTNSTLNVTANNTVSFAAALGTANIGGLAGSGNLTLSDLSATSVAVTVSVGANNANTTYSGALSGLGGLTKVGTGTLTLSGASTYTGTTAINGGTVMFSAMNNLGAASPNSGVAGITFGTATVPGGTLKYAPGNTADITVREVSVAGGGTIDTNGNNVSFLGVIGSGASTGGFTKAGAGTLSFRGANAYVGATTVNGGTLNINADNRLGAFTISVNQSSTSSPNVTLNGAAPNGFGVGSVLLGQTVLSINGTAVVLSGNASNTITANTTVSWVNSALNLNGGTLQFGAQFSLSETTVGPANRNLVLGASGGTVDTNGFNITLPAATLGTGSLTKAGAGTLTLSGGSNSYSGSTIVNGGTLALAATTSLPNSTSLQLGGGTLTVGNAALGLNFAAGGTQVNSGASAIVATSSTGTTSLGALSRGTGGTLNITLPMATGSVTTTSSNDSTGILGGWAIVPSGTSNEDWARNDGTGKIAALASYSGTWGAGNNTDASGTMSVSGTTHTVRFNGAASTTINLTGAGTIDSGGILVTGNVGANATSISGSTLNGAAGSDLIVQQYNSNTTSAGALTINSQIIDNGGATALTKAGPGMLILGNSSNSYSGPTNLNGGLVQFSALGDLGTNTSLNFNGGGLQYNGTSIDLSTSRTLTLNAGGGTIDTNGNNVTFANAVGNGGNGGLTKAGAGTLTLSAANTYSGATSVNGGTLAFSNLNNFGTGISFAFGGGTLQYAPGNTADLSSTNPSRPILGDARIVTVNAGGGTIDTNGNNVTFLNGIGNGGAGGFTKAGAGTLALLGASTYNGSLSINGGILNVGADNRLGNIGTIGNITSSTSSPTVTSTITTLPAGFGIGSALLGQTVSNVVVGASTTITLSGNANTALSNNTASFLANATVNFNGGTLQFAPGAAFSLQETTGAAANRFIAIGSSGATFDTNGNNDTLPGPISGSGAGASLTKIGAGTLTLSSAIANTFGGPTIISAGGLTLGTAGTLPATSLQLGGGTLTVANAALGVNEASGGTTINNGGSAIVATTSTGTTALGALSRNVGGTLDITLPTATGTVTTTLGNTSNILGGWATVAGTDWAANNGSNTVIALPAGSYTNDSWSAGNNTTVTTSSAPSSGSTTNSLRFNGGGANTITLSGTDIISSGGVLVTGNVGANGSTITGGTLEGAAGADLIVNQNDVALGGALTIGSVIANNGGATALTKAGAGTLILTNASNSYSGATNLNGGLVQASALGNLGTGTAINFNGGGLQYGSAGFDISAGTVTIGAAGATIDTNGNSVNFANAIGNSGIGGLTKTGAGTLTLHGSNSYTGPTNVAQGTLALDFTTGSPTSNILSPSLVRLNGGTLQVTGASGSTNSQTLIGLDVASGASVLNLSSGSGGSLNLNLGTLTRSGPGSTLEIIGPTSGTISALPGNGVAFNAVANTTGGQTNGVPLIGQLIAASTSQSNKGTFATYGTSDFAAVDASGHIVPAASIPNLYTPAFPPNNNNTATLLDVTAVTNANGAGTSNQAQYAVRFNTPGVAADTFNVRAVPNSWAGILVTPNIGAQNIQMNASGSGSLGSGRDGAGANDGFVFWQNNTLGELQLNTSVNNGAQPGAIVMQSGPGTIVYNPVVGGTTVQDNGYTGQTYLNGGYSLIARGTSLGFGTIGVASSSTSSPTVTLQAAAPVGFGVGTAFLGQIVTAINGTTVTLSGSAESTISANTNVAFMNAANLNGGTIVGNAGTPAAPLQLDTSANLSTGAANPAQHPVALLAGGGAIAATTGTALKVDGVVSGSAPLTIGTATVGGTGPGTANTTALIGDGTVYFSGTNTFTSNVNLANGTLRIDSDVNLGNPLNNINFTGSASGGNTSTPTNLVTLQLSSSAGAVSTARKMTIGSGITGTFDTNGASNLLTASGIISGAGMLSKIGAGELKLTAANTYTAGTLVSGGILRVSNTSGSGTGTGSVTVASGGTLAGTGSISGPVEIQSGGNLAPGASVGQINLSTLTLDSGAGLTYEFNNTPANDLTVVSQSGGLTVNGGAFTLLNENSVLAFATPGTYHLVQFTGAIGGTGLDSSWTTSSATNPHIANPQTGFSYSFNSSGGFINLVISNLTINGVWNNAAGGLWSNSSNWDGGQPQSAGDVAKFTKSTITSGAIPVTLDANRTVGEVQFNSNGSASYTISSSGGSVLTLNASGGGAKLTDQAGSHAINAPISMAEATTVNVVSSGDTLTLGGQISGGASASLNKTGPGTLALTNTSNTYSGNTTIGQGTVQFAALGSLGTGAINFGDGTNGGTLKYAIGNTADISTRTVTINAGGATIDTNGNNVTYANSVGNSGAGGLTKAGTGTLALTANNSYSGPTTINGGVLSVDTNLNSGTGRLGTSTNDAANLVINGGTLQYIGTGDTTDRLFTVGNNGAAIDSSNASPTGGLNFSNSSALVMTSSPVTRTLTLTGTNTLSNTFSPTIGDAVFNTVPYATSLVKSGTGMWTLSSNNTFTGPTTLSSGTLGIGSPLALQNSSLAYNTSGGTLLFVNGIAAATIGSFGGNKNLPLLNDGGGLVALTIGGNGASTQYDGVLSDNSLGSSLTKTGAGMLTLTGQDTYTGATTITGAGGITLQGTAQLNGTSSVTLSGQLAGEQLIVRDNASITTPGSIFVDGNGDGTNAFGASMVLMNNATVTAGASAASGAAFSFGNGAGRIQSGTFLTIQDNASLLANGTFDLNNTVNGTTVASNNALNLNGGLLAINGFIETNMNTTHQATINFNGGLLKALQPSSTFLPVPNNGGLTVNVQAGGAIIDTNGNDIQIDQPLLHAGTGVDGGLTKRGVGTLTLTGLNTYTGTTKIVGGTVQLGANNTINSASNLQMAGGGLSLNNFSDQFGTLRVTANSTWDTTSGTGEVLRFADSNLTHWAWGTANAELTINNWTGSSTDSSGSNPNLFLFNGSNSLNANQLSQIKFNGSGDNFAQLIAITSGPNVGKFELVPSVTQVNPSDILRLGDINQDGAVNVADISALMVALSDTTDYVKGTLKYPGTSTFVRGGASPGPDWSSDPSKLARVADLNLDDTLTNTDIQSLINYIANGANGGSGSITAVPEPASLVLLGLALPAIGLAWRRRSRTLNG